MQTLDLRQIMAGDDIAHTQARERVRKRLKSGHFWSRLNPDLLSGAELLPYIAVDSPPKSAAELVPFPVSQERLKNLDSSSPGYLEELALEKIRWCYPTGIRPDSVIKGRVLSQLEQYYDLSHPRPGFNYHWFNLDLQRSPYRPLLATIFPALLNYVQEPVSLPVPPVDEPREAWYTPEADQYGVIFRLATTLETEDSLVLAVSLTAKDTFWTRTYKLNPDRYAFIRQQLFFLLGPRLEPWDEGIVQQPGAYRGLVYRKPKNKY